MKGLLQAAQKNTEEQEEEATTSCKRWLLSELDGFSH